MMDIDGLLTTGRKEGSLEGHKVYYAKEYPAMRNLQEVIESLKPSVRIVAGHSFIFNS